jgi:uncharacterized protein YciI
MDVPNNMRNYQVGFLYRGENYLTRGTPEQTALQQRHLAYNRKAYDAGKYKAFGPITDNGDVIAITVMDVATADEAMEILNGDPAIQVGHFRAEVHPLFWPSLDAVVLDYPPKES